MQDKIYLWEQYNYEETSEFRRKQIRKDFCYDLSRLQSEQMQMEFADFIQYRCRQACVTTVYGEHQYFKKVCCFLQRYGKKEQSFLDAEAETWMRRMKMWMLQEGIPISHQKITVYGGIYTVKARELGYLERLLQFLAHRDQKEIEKDIWQLDKLEIQFRENFVKNFKTINFKQITQAQIREELKRGIYLNLQGEAISCVQREMTAMRRLSRYLKEKQPNIHSCKEFDRKLIEEYLIYLKTEAVGTKHFHTELNRLRAILESIGQILDYQNLNGLFLTRDIPPEPKAEFKTYSDAELKRLNAAIVKMDEQIARLMIIHQMLGTRISDTLTLKPDCLQRKGADVIIRIRQMKTGTYEKPISVELATLIQKAIDATRERYGDTPYIFMNESDLTRPLQYGTLQEKVRRMIYD